jgi:hypothetical protein
MDISELKKVSDRSYDLALTKQNALEKAHSRMLVAYEGRLLKADAETINLVKNLSEDRQEFVILDINNNPVLVQDPRGLLELLKSKNQEVLNSYYHTYQEFLKTR